MLKPEKGLPPQNEIEALERVTDSYVTFFRAVLYSAFNNISNGLYSDQDEKFA